MKTYHVLLRPDLRSREVQADGWNEIAGWMVFHRKPPTGGFVEYWRVQVSDLVSMETKNER